MSINFEQLSPRELSTRLVQIVWQRKIPIALTFLCTVLSAYAYLQLQTERYSADALLLVKLGRENAELPPTVARGTITTLGVRKEEINSNVSLLSSRNLIDAVVTELGPNAFKFTDPVPTNQFEAIKLAVKTGIRWGKKQYKEMLIATKLEKRLSEHEEAIEYCLRFLQIERLKDSDVIRITCTMPDPQLAVKIEDTLLRLYLERHISVHSDVMEEGFFPEQVAAFKKQLDELDQRILELRKRDQISSIDQERQLILNRLHALYQDRDARRDELSFLSDSPRTVQRAEWLPATPGHAAPSELMTQSANAASKDDARGDATSGDSASGDAPLVEADPEQGLPLPIFSQTDVMQHLLGRYLERVRLTAFRGSQADTLDIQTIDNEINRLQLQLKAALESTVARAQENAVQLENRLRELNASQIELQQLERDRTLAEKNYFNYVERMENDRIARELDRSRIANVSVLSEPSVSPNPVHPKKKLIMVAAMVGGLALALGLALIWEYFDDTIRTAADVTELNDIPLLGTIRTA